MVQESALTMTMTSTVQTLGVRTDDQTPHLLNSILVDQVSQLVMMVAMYSPLLAKFSDLMSGESVMRPVMTTERPPVFALTGLKQSWLTRV